MLLQPCVRVGRMGEPLKCSLHSFVCFYHSSLAMVEADLHCAHGTCIWGSPSCTGPRLTRAGSQGNVRGGPEIQNAGPRRGGSRCRRDSRVVFSVWRGCSSGGVGRSVCPWRRTLHTCQVRPRKASVLQRRRAWCGSAGASLCEEETVRQVLAPDPM